MGIVTEPEDGELDGKNYITTSNYANEAVCNSEQLALHKQEIYFCQV